MYFKIILVIVKRICFIILIIFYLFLETIFIFRNKKKFRFKFRNNSVDLVNVFKAYREI